MLVSCRTSRILFEAAERFGVAPSELTDPLGLAIAPLMDPSGAVSWDTLTRLFAKLEELVGDEGLQAIGRQMTYVPTYDALRHVARTALSIQRLYILAERWVAPANFPHLQLFLKPSPGRRMSAHGVIPARYAASAPFFHLVIGTMIEMPVLMGLPPSRVIDERVDPRSFDLDLELPEAPMSAARLASQVASFVRRRSSTGALEEQRRALARGFETVERARDELRAILEHLPDLVFIHDDGCIVFANRALVKLLGWSTSSDIVGRQVADIVHPASLRAIGKTTGPAESEGLEQARFKTRDDKSVVVELAPVREVVFGAATALLVVGRDLHERERLHQRLAAADRLASVGVLAAGVAHEINNPLAYVLNNIEIARHQVSAMGAPGALAGEALGVALEGVARIREIVRELLQLARADETALGPTNVHAVVESTLSLARVEIQRTATLVREFEAVPMVNASAPRVAQIVLNLVLNALEAMRGRPAAENQLVVRLTTDKDGRVVIEVSDNGVGIPPSELSRVFEYFYTTKPEGRGPGLGLAITQRMVVELGGEIVARARDGGGSTFCVHLPSVESDVDRPAGG